MSNKNGKEKQDSVIAQFKRDTRSEHTNGAVKSSIEAGRKNAEYQAQKRAEAKDKPRFIPGSAAFHNQD